MWVIDHNSITGFFDEPAPCGRNGYSIVKIFFAPFLGTYPSLLLTSGSFDVPHH